MTTKRAYVIGHPIGHSRSPLMHGYWISEHGLDARYDKLDVPPRSIGDFFERFRRERFIGANVTIPHKLAVMEHVDRIEDEAMAMGAVNCLYWDGDVLVGGNTDAQGILGSLDESVPGWDADAGQAFVYGAGGAARAAAYAFRNRGLRVAICNRTRQKAKELAAHLGAGVTAHGLEDLPGLLAEADVVINTTSLGMAGQPPNDLDLCALRPGAVVYDAVYTPLETDMVRKARASGHPAVGGLGMLLNQGAEGFRRWFGILPTITSELRQILEDDIRHLTPGA
ncbi:shikimate dehydrogenase [Sulfitobacter sp. LCG007]